MLKGRVHSVLIALFAGLFVVTLAPDSLLAQDTTNTFIRNAIYVEGLGQGVLYSVNYDHLFTRHVDLRVGFTSWSIDLIPSVGRSYFTGVPLMVNYIVGGHINHIETGIGAIVGFTSWHRQLFGGSQFNPGSSAVLGTATIAYRGETPGGGPMVRLAFTPFFTFKRIVPYAGISLGYCF